MLLLKHCPLAGKEKQIYSLLPESRKQNTKHTKHKEPPSTILAAFIMKRLLLDSKLTADTLIIMDDNTDKEQLIRALVFKGVKDSSFSLSD